MCGSKPKESEEDKKMRKLQLRELRERRQATLQAKREAEAEKASNREDAFNMAIHQGRADLGFRSLISGKAREGGRGFIGKQYLHRVGRTGNAAKAPKSSLIRPT